MSARDKKYRQDNYLMFKLKSVKKRARKKHIEFNLRHDDLIIPDVCPVLGIPLFKAEEPDFIRWNNPSLDRINPNKGYVKDNVRVVSNRANTLKSDATIEELELILADARNIKNGYCKGTVRSPDVEDDVDATGRQP